MMDNTQESNVTVKDLKKISIAAASAINGGGRKSLGGGGRRTSWRLWCSGLVCVTGTDTSFKFMSLNSHLRQGKSLHQRDSIPHNVDPDIDRWIMPNIRLQPVLPILINTSFRKMCTKKQGVSIWFHAELEALQNEEKLNNLEIKMPEIFGGYITYALKTACKSWLLKLAIDSDVVS
ncbi:hypothetical protein F2Q69_00060041 [Brassica cretica]|uniref:Uncharacterized protein n=1 Tax=Brassica cretica TaxID=69181 RepID=A0A8S9RJ88_BRACR|nr:hypothetical protein F2Q69_00060041 [Brassica cretica]